MMTDNEKAATFIGWIPCDRPSGKEPFPSPHPDYEYDKKTDRFRCRYCSRDTQADLRDVHSLCPDMTRPENYMRALGKLYAESTTEERDLIMSALEETLFQEDARAVVAFLAALYDDEHKS